MRQLSESYSWCGPGLLPREELDRQSLLTEMNTGLEVQSLVSGPGSTLIRHVRPWTSLAPPQTLIMRSDIACLAYYLWQSTKLTYTDVHFIYLF